MQGLGLGEVSGRGRPTAKQGISPPKLKRAKKGELQGFRLGEITGCTRS